MPSARPIPVIMLTMKTERLNSRASSAAMPRPTMMESRAISVGIKPATTAPNTSSRITMEIGSPKSSSPCWRSLADRVVKSCPTVWSPVTATQNPPLPRSLSRRLRGPEVSEGQVQHVRAAARAVVGGDGVVADQQREEEQAAGLDIVRVGAEGAEQRAQAIHAPVVDAPEPLGDRRVAPGPVADREVGPQDAGGGVREQLPELRAGVATLALKAFDHLVGGRPLPGVEHLGEQRAAVGEVPVEPAPGDAERTGQQLDPDGIRAAGGQGPQPLFDPPAAGRAGRGGHRLPLPDRARH